MPRSITDQQKTMTKIELMDMFYVIVAYSFLQLFSYRLDSKKILTRNFNVFGCL